jgi:hypothetical protein
VVTVALNWRRRRRAQWVPIDQAPAPPILDDAEQRWTDEQRRRLSHALLRLDRDERNPRAIRPEIRTVAVRTDRILARQRRRPTWEGCS